MIFKIDSNHGAPVIMIILTFVSLIFSGFKEGKENTTSPIISGKWQRKPVAPPALTANIVPS